MKQLELLLEKIGAKDLATLKQWHSDNDDAFFDSLNELGNDGYITKAEFNTLLELVGENGNI